MEEWKYIEAARAFELTKLHYFSVKKKQTSGPVEFKITVREVGIPETTDMAFYAEADKATNQKVAPFIPCGWGKTLEDAVRLCIQNIQRFDYEPTE
jgi:hypothetical protein